MTSYEKDLRNWWLSYLFKFFHASGNLKNIVKREGRRGLTHFDFANHDAFIYPTSLFELLKKLNLLTITLLFVSFFKF